MCRYTPVLHVENMGIIVQPCITCVKHVYYICSTHVLQVMCDTPKTVHMYYTFNLHMAHFLVYLIKAIT